MFYYVDKKYITIQPTTYNNNYNNNGNIKRLSSPNKRLRSADVMQHSSRQRGEGQIDKAFPPLYVNDQNAYCFSFFSSTCRAAFIYCFALIVLLIKATLNFKGSAFKP